MEKFKKESKQRFINPIDWYNFNGSFVSIFEHSKKYHIHSEKEICSIENIKTPCFVLKDKGLVEVTADNPLDMATGITVTKFMLLTAVKFKGDYLAAMSYVRFYLLNDEIPYIRVGSDYFKMITKLDRYGGKHQLLRHWKKDEIKEDHSKELLKLIFKFDDFDIIPTNTEFIPVRNNCYNLYSKFSHEPSNEDTLLNDIPNSYHIMNHIFGNQLELGFKYLKILYENPTQILPILSLVSSERGTGKTTFLNWVQMIFGENSVLISPSDLMGNFNSVYATKNIIMIDETVIEKSASIEKLKSLATAKSISVSQKHVSEYSIPFFGKIILCTNKEVDFMRIDEDEIRFWVRKIRPVEQLNTNIENDLFKEIPKFLKYLKQLPEIDFSKSRMVFTKDELLTEELINIKEESHSSLYKELEILIDDYFNEYSGYNEFYATPTDIKNKWFFNNNTISINYIRKVLKEEMKMLPEEMMKYSKFNEDEIKISTGTPFKFIRKLENKDKYVYEAECQF